MRSFLNKFSDLGILFIRLGVGVPFIFIYGWGKITGGPELWGKLGKAMSNLGITFYPEFWGFMASASEFFGGILIVLGLFTRTTSLFMSFTMFVAILNHLSKLDPWSRVFHPIEILAVFLCLIFTGAGKFSFDSLILKKR